MSTTPAIFVHLQPTTSVSGTKVFPGGLPPPAIAKSLAEIAEIAWSGNSVSPSSAQGPHHPQPTDLGRAEAAVRAFNEIFSANR